MLSPCICLINWRLFSISCVRTNRLVMVRIWMQPFRGKAFADKLQYNTRILIEITYPGVIQFGSWLHCQLPMWLVKIQLAEAANLIGPAPTAAHWQYIACAVPRLAWVCSSKIKGTSLAQVSTHPRGLVRVVTRRQCCSAPPPYYQVGRRRIAAGAGHGALAQSGAGASWQKQLRPPFCSTRPASPSRLQLRHVGQSGFDDSGGRPLSANWSCTILCTILWNMCHYWNIRDIYHKIFREIDTQQNITKHFISCKYFT